MKDKKMKNEQAVMTYDKSCLAIKAYDFIKKLYDKYGLRFTGGILAHLKRTFPQCFYQQSGYGSHLYIRKNYIPFLERFVRFCAKHKGEKQLCRKFKKEEALISAKISMGLKKKKEKAKEKEVETLVQKAQKETYMEEVYIYISESETQMIVNEIENKYPVLAGMLKDRIKQTKIKKAEDFNQVQVWYESSGTIPVSEYCCDNDSVKISTTDGR